LFEATIEEALLPCLKQTIASILCYTFTLRQIQVSSWFTNYRSLVYNPVAPVEVSAAPGDAQGTEFPWLPKHVTGIEDAAGHLNETTR